MVNGGIGWCAWERGALRRRVGAGTVRGVSDWDIVGQHPWFVAHRRLCGNVRGRSKGTAGCAVSDGWILWGLHHVFRVQPADARLDAAAGVVESGRKRGAVGGGVSARHMAGFSPRASGQKKRLSQFFGKIRRRERLGLHSRHLDAKAH